MIIGFDPGRDKCGVAVRNDQGQFPYHKVVNSEDVIATLQSLCKQFPITLLVMGNQTTSKQWKKQLKSKLSSSVSIEMVDERNSSLEARDRYWEMYPLQGLTRIIPLGMRFPSRPIDDIVAIVLIERYLNRNNL
ncbi:MAG: pre-16S rRNA-processing nuclease YqgF [cyanobacterium endosymbiont of Rhopalodia musculus]|uniref:pre-16S rRNA-processing nuclease YqgF n=1 Tax=cyanobacterium endosymbiont of Epithemia clementina EcSB TaxID=3034674 RepID=UPI00248050D3|nr:pre-16S rRNA-processing nuclease YqgF [cyanobacterium endosymbiont of Epithemia clementina EcSB]WGT67430.1 pre-16S rRNA-processing nuclease YqgF [cyanobacterium endosymbiont of Epithemia clementina EcSB]